MQCGRRLVRDLSPLPSPPPLPFLAPDTRFDGTRAGAVHLWSEAINPDALLPLERVSSTGHVWLFPATAPPPLFPPFVFAVTFLFPTATKKKKLKKRPAAHGRGLCKYAHDL